MVKKKLPNILYKTSKKRVIKKDNPLVSKIQPFTNLIITQLGGTMNNFELEEYIKKNTEEIIKVYIDKLKRFYAIKSIDEILSNTEDISFLSHMRHKRVEIKVVDVLDAERYTEDREENEEVDNGTI